MEEHCDSDITLNLFCFVFRPVSVRLDIIKEKYKILAFVQIPLI